tara:strand:- start:63 stop:569 length:507 start_codon:yes stop_codon:yes gene_type:complete
MHKSFVSADWHLGHKNIVNFLDDEGKQIRPYADVDEMHADLIARHNAVVRPVDRVYVLGDVAMQKSALQILPQFNGRKVLIKGNHDIYKLKDYLPYFDDIRAYHVLDKFILSHIPVHEGSKGRFKGNIHGHLHANKIDDPWYRCVSLEHTDFAPVSFAQIVKDYDAGK